MKIELKGKEFKNIVFCDQGESNCVDFYYKDSIFKFYKPLDRAISAMLNNNFVILDSCDVVLYGNEKQIIIGFKMVLVDIELNVPFMFKMDWGGYTDEMF